MRLGFIALLLRVSLDWFAVKQFEHERYGILVYVVLGGFLVRMVFVGDCKEPSFVPHGKIWPCTSKVYAISIKFVRPAGDLIV